MVRVGAGIEENKVSDAEQLERLEQLGRNLEKQLDLRNSSNSDNSNTSNGIAVIQDVNDTAFFEEVLDYRRDAW